MLARSVILFAECDLETDGRSTVHIGSGRQGGKPIESLRNVAVGSVDVVIFLSKLGLVHESKRGGEACDTKRQEGTNTGEYAIQPV
jgi:hypothetical protein